MGSDQGTFTLTTGTGHKYVSLGSDPDWAEIFFEGSSIKPSKGSWHGGNQFALPDGYTAAVSGRFFKVYSSGGSLVLEGEISAVASGIMDIYVYTQSGSVPQAFMRWGNY